MTCRWSSFLPPVTPTNRDLNSQHYVKQVSKTNHTIINMSRGQRYLCHFFSGMLFIQFTLLLLKINFWDFVDIMKVTGTARRYSFLKLKW